MRVGFVRERIERAYRCLADGNNEVAAWILAGLHDDLAAEQDSRGDEAYLARVWRAMMLAADYDACCALLRGEDVPASRLDPEGMRRFARRR